MKMKKLKLDALEVESFATESTSRERGTVQAHLTGPSCDTCRFWTCYDTCDPNATCGLSCNGSCGGATCDPNSTCTCM